MGVYRLSVDRLAVSGLDIDRCLVGDQRLMATG